MFRFVVMKDYLTILAAFVFCNALPLISLSQEKYIPDEETLSEHVVKLGLNRGFLMTHHDFMDYYLRDKTTGFTLSIEKKLKGGWTDNFGYISRGVEIYRTSLSNDELLGHATHFVLFSNLGIHSNNKGKLKLGAGIGFLTEKFDLDKNYKNQAIGSTANAAIVFEYGFSYPVAKKWSFSPNLRFTHYSNGAYKLPNLGLNVVSVGISLERKIVNESINADVQKKSYSAKKLSLGVSYGRNEFLKRNSGQFSNVNLDLHYINSDKNKLILGLGTDIHYSEALLNYYEQGVLPYEKVPVFKASTRIGISGLIGLKLGSAEVHGLSGFYIYDHQKKSGSVYQRFYILQHITNSLQIRLGLKTHLTKAETVEVGINKNLWSK